MISSRYRFWVLLNTVASPLTYRYLTVTLPLLTVTDCSWPLRNVTHRYRYSPFFWKFNIFFIAVLKVGGFWLNYEKHIEYVVLFFLKTLSLLYLLYLTLPYVKSSMQPKFVTKNKQLALISYYFEYICKRTCMNKKQRAFI